VAGSIVVREQLPVAVKPSRSLDVGRKPSPATVFSGASRLAPEEMVLVETFLNRRFDLTPDVRTRTAAQILARLRDRCPFGVSGTDESILEALARASRDSGAY
jgi:hypothetical protein